MHQHLHASYESQTLAAIPLSGQMKLTMHTTVSLQCTQRSAYNAHNGQLTMHTTVSLQCTQRSAYNAHNGKLTMHTTVRMGDAALATAVLYPRKVTQISCDPYFLHGTKKDTHFFFKGGRINLLWVTLYHFLIFKLLLQFIITTPTNEK